MNASQIKTLETATAISTGGRNGHSETDDSSVKVDLSVRKGMGGPGTPGTTTPEHLFAAGYAACFGGALDAAAQRHKVKAADVTIECAVSVGPREGGGYGIAVKITASSPSIANDELKKLADEAHEKICPYSHATRGNIPFELTVKGA
jgi:Ohr subfamily peroxiredoxin